MSKVQTNLIQAQESLFFLLKEITDKSDEEIKNLSIDHEASSVSDRLTVSIGLACFVPTYGTSSEKLVARADIALYKAKENGRNRTHIYQVS